MIAVTVEFRIKPQHVQQFRRAVLAQAANSLRAESTCRQFDVCFDPQDPAQVFLYETYDDRAAFDHHLTTTHFHDFNAAVADWVADKRVRTWDVSSFGGKT